MSQVICDLCLKFCLQKFWYSDVPYYGIVKYVTMQQQQWPHL